MTIKWERLGLLRGWALLLGAFACILYGVFQLSVPVGWIVTGLALLLVAFLTDGPGDSKPNERGGGR